MSAVEPLQGKRILVTGVTGMVAGPVAGALAAVGNTVYGAARFKDPSTREPVEAAGVRPVRIDLAKGELDEVPRELDLVLNFAVSKTNDFERALTANAEGAALLMERCRGADAFFHCSSTAVYEPHGHEPRREGDPLGDSHRPMGLPTYSISKIAAEVMVKHAAKRLGLPTVIARLNVPYGDTYGWPLLHLVMMDRGIPIPVHVDGPTQYTPIHSDDIVASIPYLLSAASVPATIVNWGGDEVASIEEWCVELGRLTGLTPTFEPTDRTIATIVPDLERLHALGFHAAIAWRGGFRRMVATSRPDLYRG